jgi:hypothetical protein
MLDSFLAFDINGGSVIPFFKDEALDRLAAYGNVAQFASFDPTLAPRYSRMLNRPPNEGLELGVAIATLLAASPERKINVRSFRPENHQGNEFIYGLADAKTAIEHVHRLADLKLYVILNETVDVNDGGVSGVSQGSIIEFAPGGTPRVVDAARTVSLRLPTGLRILESVYGFSPELPFPQRYRVEFSIHPIRRGCRRSHTIIWELEEVGYEGLLPNPRWPNDFSEFMGDKVFGLLVADGEGYNVPRTKVLSRHLPPFSFGSPTETDVTWIRTAPRMPAPGHFTTVRGWSDPFKLLTTEDPEGTNISSVLIQDEVAAEYSGALLTDVNGEPIIEGVPGRGDALMLGSVAPSRLPEHLLSKLRDLHGNVRNDFGSIRIEWVFDGERVWILQLQQEAQKSAGTVIVDGDFSNEITYRTEAGLEKLHVLTRQLSKTGGAIRLVGNVGITSHMADILRRANVPSRLVRE